MLLLVSLNVFLRPFSVFMARFNVLPCFWYLAARHYFNTGISLPRKQPDSLLLSFLAVSSAWLKDYVEEEECPFTIMVASLTFL